MALRAILSKNEDILRKKCKKVEVFDQKLWTLLDDMAETMRAANGLGLAAPQVGILRRVFVMDTGDGLIEAINPIITDTSGSQRDVEGCLSCPEEWGYVTRPMNCKLKAQDRNGNWFEKDLTGMACRCACHESDHLDGKLFIDIVEEMVKIEED
jgi:peptide deformylase